MSASLNGPEIISVRLQTGPLRWQRQREQSLPEIYFCKLEGAAKSAAEEQRGVPRRSQEGRPVVQDHPHGHLLQIGDEPPLGEEGLEEAAAGEPGEDLGRNPPSQVGAAGGGAEERQVAGERAVGGHEQVERPRAELAALRTGGERRLADDFRRLLSPAERLAYPGALRHPPHVAQEVVDVKQPR